MAEITNELLKQAIADADAVRDMAIANAKIALEETFTPQIKSMLAKRLRAEAMEATEGAEKAKEEPFQDADPVGSSEMPADSSTIGTGDNKEPSPASFDSADDDKSGEGHTDSSTDWYDDWSESDFDLDEVIKELEEDVKALSEAEEEEEEELDEAKHEGEEDEKEEMKEGYNEAEEEMDEYGGEEVEKTPAASPTDVHDKEVPAQSSGIGKAEAASTDAFDPHKRAVNPAEPRMEMGDMGMKKGHEAGEGEGEEELDLEAILRELEAQDEKDKKQKHQMASKMEALQKELAEYRKVVEVLRGKLNEVNLLNAKLLYTNKIFRKEGLTNEQKVAILESFDRAINVREVKMVYATLAEAMTVTAKNAKGRTVSSKVVTEGLASKPTPSTAPKKEILEENTVAKRLQQLAGIL